LNDIPFITNLEERDRKAGHYGRKQYVDGDPDELFVRNCHEMITNGVCLTTGDGIAGEIWISEFERQPIGFCFMAELPEDVRPLFFSEPTREIWMFSVADDHRGKGHGKAFLREVLEWYKPQRFLFARCSGASKVMVSLLERQRFVYLATSRDGFAGYGRGNRARIEAIGAKMREAFRRNKT
jgi:GNAT superfamily N-acetyltransferase